MLLFCIPIRPISDIPVPPLFSGKNDVNEKIIVIYPPLIYLSGITQVKLSYDQMHTGPLTINQNNSFIDLFYIRFFWEYDPGTPLNMNVKFELKNELNTTITYHSKIFNNTLIFGTNTFNIVSDPLMDHY